MRRRRTEDEKRETAMQRSSTMTREERERLREMDDVAPLGGRGMSHKAATRLVDAIIAEGWRHSSRATSWEGAVG